jgi:predicted Zn finger-like uncharacterized protein
MSEEKFTRCPECRTVFRVTPEQLALRGGQVRCGHCKTAFDGVDQLISLAPPPFDGDDDPVDDAAQGPPPVTLRSAQALEPPCSGVAAAAVAPPPEPRAPPAAVEPPGADETGGRSAVAVAFYALAIGALVVLLAGQAVFHYRDSLVARWPAAKPLLSEMCAVAGCTVRPPHEIADLSIQASDLQADSAHKGLLTLTATVRNRAAIALAYPHLELALTDAQDQVVVRRALAPAEYAGGTADIASGIPPNGEAAVKLFIDASATTQAGYRLYLFYP